MVVQMLLNILLEGDEVTLAAELRFQSFDPVSLTLGKLSDIACTKLVWVDEVWIWVLESRPVTFGFST